MLLQSWASFPFSVNMKTNLYIIHKIQWVISLMLFVVTISFGLMWLLQKVTSFDVTVIIIISHYFSVTSVRSSAHSNSRVPTLESIQNTIGLFSLPLNTEHFTKGFIFRPLTGYGRCIISHQSSYKFERMQ